MQTRDATPQDAPAIAVLVKNSITQLCILDHAHDKQTLTQWLINKTPKDILDWIESADNKFIVIEKDNEIIGVGLVTDKGRIELNYVSPDMRFQGVSKLILNTLESYLKMNGHTQCKLDATLTARSFYYSQGYEDTSAPQKCGLATCQPMKKLLGA